MGVGPSQEQIQQTSDRVAEILGTFSTTFVKAAAIAHVKAICNGTLPESNPDGEEPPPPKPYDDLKLNAVPDGTKPLKSGMMKKQGAVNKGWKDRYFIAGNKADNYEIQYFDKEGGKQKGVINCAGYHVDQFSALEREEHGELAEFGVVLRPWDDRRRTWYLSAENAEDQKEWTDILENACWRSDPPFEEDPLLREAFEIAFWRTRWQYSYWSWWTYNMSEGELLGVFVSDIVKREVFPSGLDDFPSTAVNTFFATAVVAPVNTQWKALIGSIKGTKDTLIDTIRGQMELISSTKEDLKQQIVDKISGVVNPPLQDAGGSLLAPVLDVVFAPLVGSYISAFRGLVSDVRERSERLKSDIGSLENEMDWALSADTYSWSGPREEAADMLRELRDSGLAAVADHLNDNITASGLFNDCMADLEMWLQMAHWTWKERIEAEDDKVGAVDSVLPAVLSDAIDDLKIWVQQRVTAILLGLISPIINEKVLPLALAPVEPIAEMIPEPLQEILDLQAEVEDVIGRLVDSSIEALLASAVDTQLQRIENDCRAAMA